MTVAEFADWWGYYRYRTALQDQALERAKAEAQ